MLLDQLVEEAPVKVAGLPLAFSLCLELVELSLEGVDLAVLLVQHLKLLVLLQLPLLVGGKVPLQPVHPVLLLPLRLQLLEVVLATHLGVGLVVVEELLQLDVVLLQIQQRVRGVLGALGGLPPDHSIRCRGRLLLQPDVQVVGRLDVRPRSPVLDEVEDVGQMRVVVQQPRLVHRWLRRGRARRRLLRLLWLRRGLWWRRCRQGGRIALLLQGGREV